MAPATRLLRRRGNRSPRTPHMLLLVAFVGWIVVRYARNYLNGEARQNAFTGWLGATLAALPVIVQAGNYRKTSTHSFNAT